MLVELTGELLTGPTFRALRNVSSASADDTLLDPIYAAKGTEYAGNNERLRCVVERLRARQPITVAVLGGSISAGSTFMVRRGGSGVQLFRPSFAPRHTHLLNTLIRTSDRRRHAAHTTERFHQVV